MAYPVRTVGHSNRPLEDFIALLTAHAVTLLVDVRHMPRSRHNPHFNGDTLARAVKAHAIGYVHLAGLGGFRRAAAPGAAFTITDAVPVFPASS